MLYLVLFYVFQIIYMNIFYMNNINKWTFQSILKLCPVEWKELNKALHSKNACTFITVFLIFILYLSCSKYKTSYYLLLNTNKLHKQNNQPCPWHLKGNMFKAFDLMKSKANLPPLNQTDNFQDSSFFFFWSGQWWSPHWEG